jgi:hypothetical protein
MSIEMNEIATENLAAAKSAAVITAGTIANTQLAKLVAKKSPMMIRGYVDTPIGKLVLANIVSQAFKHMRPGDAKLELLSEGMMIAAYQNVIGTIDLDGLIDEFVESASVSRVLDTLGE